MANNMSEPAPGEASLLAVDFFQKINYSLRVSNVNICLYLSLVQTNKPNLNPHIKNFPNENN
jgi:hypothetical protein